MAFAYVDSDTYGGTSGSGAAGISITHGLTISSGNLVVLYLNTNDVEEVSADQSWSGSGFQAGSAMTTAETASQSIFWKTAGSEPTAYSFTTSGAYQYRAIIYVFSCSATPSIDSAINFAYRDTAETNVVCTAASGQTVSNDCVSFIFGGKDNRGAGNTYNTGDNSYTGVVGNDDSQTTAGGYRIYTTDGETVAYNVTLSSSGINDKTYSCHVSFLEGGGGPTFTSGPTVSQLTGSNDPKRIQIKTTVT